MAVQSFVTFKWQEKKLSMIKIFKFFVSDHLKMIRDQIQCRSQSLLNFRHAECSCLFTGVLSTSGGIMSTLRDVQYIGEYHEYIGGIS